MSLTLCPHCGQGHVCHVQRTLPFPAVIPGADILRRAFDMRVIDRLERNPNTPPEDGASLAQGVVYGVSAVLEVLKDAGVPLTIEGITLTDIAQQIARTEP